MSSFGGTVKLSGENEYRRALSDITNNLKVMSSEMQIVTAQYGKNDDSIDGLTAKNKALNNQIEQQKQKVETLKNALLASKNETGENSVTTQKWQVELNKAEAQLINMNKEIDKNSKIMNQSKEATDVNSSSIKTFGDEVDKSKAKTLSLGDIIKANLISEGIISGIKALAGAFKDIGNAVLDVGKQAVESYASYEQLAGGVDTLFKESSEIVKNYANNAYKTSGLSANSYMETVTSFSASLLQSLNGDTEKSAKAADMAITDMSDNANKMGTDMSSIQTAYQGFAKQNYTMLDNLKLGYGGTKEEMQRLLDDASKLSGTKYDITNLNDVYSALHVVQTELGITGTTAKEASETISGSVSAMKSSWTNMLTGLADGNADLGGLINNVVDSALTVADNILPIVDQVASSILEVLPNLLDKIVTNLPRFLETGSSIISSIITGLQTNLPAILTAVMQIMSMLITSLIENLPKIIEMGIQMIISLVQGIAKSIPDLVPVIVDAVITIVEALIDNIGLIIDAGISIIMGLIDGLLDAMPELIDKMPEIIDKLIMALSDNLPKIVEMGIVLVVQLAFGLIKAIPQLISKIPQIITSLVDGLLNGVGNMAGVGKNLIEGLWNGIDNAKDWILKKIKGFGTAILDGIKSFFGIHSPSTVFKDEIGKNLALGLGEGFTDSMAGVSEDIQKSLPTDFDLGVNTSVNSNITESIAKSKMSNDTFGNLQNFVSKMASDQTNNTFHIQFGNVSIYNDDDIEDIASKIQKFIDDKSFSHGLIEE